MAKLLGSNGSEAFACFFILLLLVRLRVLNEEVVFRPEPPLKSTGYGLGEQRFPIFNSLINE